jgi:hypothetical protein
MEASLSHCNRDCAQWYGRVRIKETRREAGDDENHAQDAESDDDHVHAAPI